MLDRTAAEVMTESASSDPADRGSSVHGVQRRRRRRRLSSSGSTARSVPRARQIVRLTYFALATLWGFMMGTAAVLGGLSMSGVRPALGGATGITLAAAMLVALVGGAVASRAYAEASSRFR